MAMDAGKLGIWSHHVDTNEVIWDTRCRDMFGMPTGEQITFERFVESIDPETREEEVIQSIKRQRLREDGNVALEYRIELPDGTQRWILSRGRLPGAHGEPLQVDGVALDISEQKQAEVKIRE